MIFLERMNKYNPRIVKYVVKVFLCHYCIVQLIVLSLTLFMYYKILKEYVYRLKCILHIIL